MIFNYTVVTQDGEEKKGVIDAVSMDVAVSSLQRRGFVVSSIEPADKGGLFSKDLAIFERVKNKDIVILSRQISTLFEAHVSALRVFRLLGESVENPVLSRKLGEIADDIQGGMAISAAMRKHPEVFTEFYVNMVRAGEESGKLNETFSYLADYLDRSYELVSKTRNALIYPAFVIFVFIAVMVLMLTAVIPNLADILNESGTEVPVYTKMVLGISDFLVQYGFFLLFFILAGVLGVWILGPKSNFSFESIKMRTPYIGTLFTKFYLSRISDNMNTMLSSGIPMVRSVEITASVVGSHRYKEILDNAATQIKQGSSVSNALSGYNEIPNIMVQMIKVGEETGELGNILNTLSKFYKREVENAVDTLVTMIEPIMIVMLAVGVGTLLASVLIPIYQVSTSFA